MLRVLVITSTCKDRGDSGNHDIIQGIMDNPIMPKHGFKTTELQRVDWIAVKYISGSMMQ